MKKITLLLVLLVPFLGFSQNDVTFRVDMNQYSGSFNIPEVNGTFNGWCGNCAAMTDADMDGIWEILIDLPSDTFEFKFSFDNWGGQENLTPGMPCTVTNGGFTNRSLIVTGDTVLEAYCWEACSNCAGAPMNVDVTFQVDLSDYTANTYTDAHLNGTFNGWCGSCAPMADAMNDSIYSLTVSVPAGDTIEFKYTLDGWTHDEQLDGNMPCARTDGTGAFTNRFLVVPANDTVLPPVCWESCAPCGTIGLDESWIEGFSLSPNPSQGVFSINGHVHSSDKIVVSVRDLKGKLVYQNVLSGVSNLDEEIDLSHLNNGVYGLSLESGQDLVQQKVVITH